MTQWYKSEQKFFGMTTAPENNVITTEFESGKVRYQLRNSTPKLTHSFSFLLKSKEDELAFWNWYNNDLLSRTQTVELYDLVKGAPDKKEYRMTTEPAVQDSQYPKECQINVKEE